MTEQQGTMARIPFEREADMLASIVRAFPAVRGRPLRAFFEVQTMQGIADIVLVDLIDEALREREQSGQGSLTEAGHIAVVHALSTSGDVAMSTGQIADCARTSASHLRRSIIPSLIAAEWVRPAGLGEWQLRNPYRSPVRRIVAIEVKRSEWRTAIRQVLPHTEFANATYVALDAARTPSGDGWTGPFLTAGVGLVAVQATPAVINDPASASVTRVVRARERRPRGLARSVLAERIASLSRSGISSGRLGAVFGRIITSRWGVDVRIASNPAAED